MQRERIIMSIASWNSRWDIVEVQQILAHFKVISEQLHRCLDRTPSSLRTLRLLSHILIPWLKKMASTSEAVAEGKLTTSFKQDQSRYVRTFLRKVATSYHEWTLSKWRAIPLLKVLFVIQMYLIYCLYVIIILGTSFYELCWLQWNTVGNKSVQPFPEKIWKGEWETFERRFLQNCLTKFSR